MAKNNMNNRTVVLLVSLCCVLVANAAAPGRHLSGDYVMTVDGKEVDVISVPTPEKHIWNKLERQPYSFAPFVASKEVEVCVRTCQKAKWRKKVEV